MTLTKRFGVLRESDEECVYETDDSHDAILTARERCESGVRHVVFDSDQMALSHWYWEPKQEA